jgi:peptidoglycan/xylan/chitin deacetylase (PgdA/CDA1 family)
MSRQRAQTLILTYHRLYETAERDLSFPASANFYALSANSFRNQLTYLEKCGFRAFLLEEFLMSESRIDRRNVVITFDDGYESDFAIALPLLLEFGFRAVFFICLEFVGKPGYLSWGQIRALVAAGMSVQSHGLTHRDLTKLSAVELVDELTAARISLERNLGREIRYLAIPGGFTNRRVCAAAQQAGYLGVCTSVPGAACIGKPLNRVAIRRSTSQAEFETFVCRHPVSLLRAYLAYSGAAYVKRVIGIRAYETLKTGL